MISEFPAIAPLPYRPVPTHAPTTTVVPTAWVAPLRTATPAAPDRRWIEPLIVDRATFLADHPECVISAERLEELEPEIWWRAAKIEASSDPDVQDEIRANIRLRVIEAATAYRDLDPVTGEPIYDYLRQSRRYIVWHASGKVFSQVRRERTAAKSLNIVSSVRTDDDGLTVDRLDERADAQAELAVASDLEASEFVQSVRSALSPAQSRVFDLLALGYDRPAIAETLGLSRKTIHNHVSVIREVTTAVLSRDQLDGETTMAGHSV